MEFVYIILLGDEYGVDVLESHDYHDHDAKMMLKLSSLDEGLYFLAKQNWLLVHVAPFHISNGRINSEVCIYLLGKYLLGMYLLGNWKVKMCWSFTYKCK